MMTAVVDFLRSCKIPYKMDGYDIDEWMSFADKFEDACELAANHITELEGVLLKREQRIAELEMLFEPFLKNFLREQDAHSLPKDDLSG